MISSSFNEFILENSAPVKMWTNGVPVDPKAVSQLQNTAKMPFIFKHLAVCQMSMLEKAQRLVA